MVQTQVKVKICGLTRQVDVLNAVACGADALGFVFGYQASPRNLTFSALKDLVGTVPPYVSTVVVSPASNPKLGQVISELRPAFLQLYKNSEGGSSENIARRERLRFANVIQTVHPEEETYSPNDGPLVDRCTAISKQCKGILLDSPRKNLITVGRRNHETSEVLLPGGSGAVHDWKLSQNVRNALFPFPVILSGGLNEQNVRKAIRMVRPYAVDVSSGVERSPGVKDEEKLRRFIHCAKTA